MQSAPPPQGETSGGTLNPVLILGLYTVANEGSFREIAIEYLRRQSRVVLSACRYAQLSLLRPMRCLAASTVRVIPMQCYSSATVKVISSVSTENEGESVRDNGMLAQTSPDILMSSDENDTSATIYGCRNGI